MTHRSVGRGKGIRLGTHLFQRYFIFAEPSARDLVATFLPPKVLPPVRLAPGTTARLGRMTHPQGPVLLVWNDGSEPSSFRLISQDGWRVTPHNDRGVLPPLLQPGQAVVALAAYDPASLSTHHH